MDLQRGQGVVAAAAAELEHELRESSSASAASRAHGWRCVGRCLVEVSLPKPRLTRYPRRLPRASPARVTKAAKPDAALAALRQALRLFESVRVRALSVV